MASVYVNPWTVLVFGIVRTRNLRVTLVYIVVYVLCFSKFYIYFFIWVQLALDSVTTHLKHERFPLN